VERLREDFEDAPQQAGAHPVLKLFEGGEPPRVAPVRGRERWAVRGREYQTRSRQTGHRVGRSRRRLRLGKTPQTTTDCAPDVREGDERRASHLGCTRASRDISRVRLHCIDEKRKCSCTFRESGADSCIVRA
jgi:hypothetical protein